jgi:hypothetical protein
MFARRIREDEVRTVIFEGEPIAQYPDDRPYPSLLLLGFSGGRPIHVVLGYNEPLETGFVVTAYVPSPDLWNEDFKTRRR